MVRILRVFLLAFGLAALLFGGFSAFAVEKIAPTVRYVTPDGSDPGNDCTHSTTACASIQHAVDVAAAGDEVRVAAGRYAGVRVRHGLTQTVFISQSLALRGGYTTNWTVADPKANPTILDAQGLGRVMTIRGPISVTVDGLEITGGDARGLGGGVLGFNSDSGGGIFVLTATLTLTNSRIYSNTAFDGGGLYAAQSDPVRRVVLGNSTFFSNTARGSGGGMALLSADLQVDGISVEENLAQGMAPDNPPAEPYAAPNSGGGGIYCIGCTGVLNRSHVAGNRSRSSGGGLLLNTSQVLLTQNKIVSNQAESGGGLWSFGGELSLVHNDVSLNQAFSGGGMWLYPYSASMDGNSITDNIASQGSGGGISLILTILASGRIRVWNTLLARNRSESYGGGIAIITNFFLKEPLSIANMAVIDNQSASLGGGVYIDTTGSSIELTHVTVARNSGGDDSGLYFTGTIRSDGSVLPPELASRLWITNSIVAEQSTGLFAAPNQRVAMDGILWHGIGQPTRGEGVYTMAHEFTGDPHFGADGYHLMAGSVAIDRGIATDVDIDIDGMHRPQGFAPDLGADEWEGERYFYLPNIRR